MAIHPISSTHNPLLRELWCPHFTGSKTLTIQVRHIQPRAVARSITAFSDAGFFVFGDLSVKVEGDYRLRFSLFEMLKYVTSLRCEVFDLIRMVGKRSSTSNQ